MQVVVVRGTRGREDARSQMFRQLDGESRNAAGTTLDQDRLAGFQLQRILDRQMAVRPASAMAAASTCDNAAGFFATMAALIAIFSA